MWIKALNATERGEPWGRDEWDALLGHCQAVTDAPAICFSEALLAAYPDAKIILTNRSPDSWWQSFSSTIVPTMGSRCQEASGASSHDAADRGYHAWERLHRGEREECVSKALCTNPPAGCKRALVGVRSVTGMGPTVRFLGEEDASGGISGGERFAAVPGPTKGVSTFENRI
ncbi:hypothetical protein C8F01DRAFT_1275051 [Mycena amicta]|nr:hypothetical protein C8F01DRAFT_1275051 [Mycena amicta]